MITVRNLNKSFGENVIFENFNLDVADGDFLIVSGESGSGKTTLLNMIGGIESVDSGSVCVDDVDITTLKKKRKYFSETVGFLFQNFALIENRTVEQNLKLVRDRSGMTIEEALSAVGLEKKESSRYIVFRGGEQQRAALARLLIKKCSLILADEPTGSLDARNKGIVMDMLGQMNRNGKTIIMVTHDDELIDRGNRILRI